MEASDFPRQHLRACAGFSRVVEQGDGRWERPSPCPEWDARGVVEHVIGFHDVLILRPLDAKPQRPKGDPTARWHATYVALSTVLGDLGGDLPEAPVGFRSLLPALRTEVLIHTWDLAKALGVEAGLDDDLCAVVLQGVEQHAGRYQASGMFGEAVALPAEAPVVDRLVALLGRDPAWQASSPST